MTEFIPVSSSGHLVFFQSLFGMKEPQIFFDVMLHLGTLLAVVVFFRTDIWKIAQGLGAILKKRHKNSPQVKLFLLIIIATFPTGMMGLLFGVAIIPGIFRAGATISKGFFLGLDRELSGKFSFLLSIPSILGATLLEFRKMDMNQELWTTLIGITIAFGIGILSLLFLMKIIKVGKIFNFSYYCWSLGTIRREPYEN